MPNKEKIEEQQKKVEEVKETSTEKDEEEKKPEAEQKEEKVEETKDTKTEETEAEEEKPIDKNEEEAEDDGKVVEEEVPSANAIRVQDIVTKAELDEKLQAFEAKYLALAEENKQLKEANAKLLDEKGKAETETEELKNKYERSDFGNITTKGAGSNSDKGSTYQSFDEYSKNFS